MRVLVTGGSGLIGSRLAARLLNERKTVRLFDQRMPAGNGSSSEWIRHAELITGDITDQDDLRKAVADVDVIVHLAYMMSEASAAEPMRATEINVVGAARVFEAARHAGIKRVITASSISVFGSDADYPESMLPLDDDAPQIGAKGIAVYAAGKIYMETLARRYAEDFDLEVVGVRPGVVYGGTRLSGGTAFVAQYIDKARRGEPFEIANGSVRTPLVHVDDVAGALASFVDADSSAFAKHRFFNLAGDACSFSELAAILRLIFPDASIIVHDGPEQGLLGMASRICDAAIENEVGFQRALTPLRRGIEVEAVTDTGAR